MKINMEILKDEIENLVDDKLENMCESEISEELCDFLGDKTDAICESVISILENNEIIIDDKIFNTKVKAKDWFDEDLILDWDDIDELEGEERENQIQVDILYNYDALWMAAIHKAFPNNTTDPRCGDGMMKLLK